MVWVLSFQVLGFFWLYGAWTLPYLLLHSVASWLKENSLIPLLKEVLKKWLFGNIADCEKHTSTLWKLNISAIFKGDDSENYN